MVQTVGPTVKLELKADEKFVSEAHICILVQGERAVAREMGASVGCHGNVPHHHCSVGSRLVLQIDVKRKVGGRFTLICCKKKKD